MAEVTPASLLTQEEGYICSQETTDVEDATPRKQLFCSQQECEADVEDNGDTSSGEEETTAPIAVQLKCEADVEDNFDMDSDDDQTNNVANELEEKYRLQKEEEEFVKWGTELFKQQQSFVPDIYDSDAHFYQHVRKRTNPLSWRKAADRAGYEAYLKYGWQNRKDLFSLVFESAKEAFIEGVRKSYTLDPDEVAYFEQLAGIYAEEVCMHVVIISQV